MLRVEWVPEGVRPFVSVERPQLRGKRLLVVDDNTTNRRILSTLADKWGREATVEQSGSAALARMRGGEHFDVAVIDMQMPEMDGLMLAHEIRRLSGRDTMPMILLSSIGKHAGTEEPGLFASILLK